MMTEKSKIEELEQKNKELEQRVSELEAQVEDPSVSRRSVLGALGLAGIGAGGGSLLASRTASASDGSGSIGTADNPLSEIHVNELYQNQDIISTSALSGDLVDRTEDITSLPGSIYLTEEGAEDPREHNGDIWLEVEVSE